MPVKVAQSSFRDRTQEFLSVAERLKKSITSGSNPNGPNSSSSRPVDKRSVVAHQSEFNRRASKIGLGIHHTSQKLSKLTKLAKRTSVFDDPTMEIQELTAVIKQDITALNSAVVDLQLFCNSRNKGGVSSDTSSHSTTVRPLAAKSVAGASSNLPQWANGSASSSQLFPRKHMDGEGQPLLQQHQQQQQQMVPLQDSYMQSRAEALQNVESTIHELGTIFNQLATLVSQQGEIAIRIDENMDDTLANVEGAQGALLKYLNSISSNSQSSDIAKFEPERRQVEIEKRKLKMIMPNQ
ncbi:Syntaxin-32 [Hibiscus syriacus]|uniref:Syntaxin-32 n=1 Tax=Hibiscus syriacus TaxID=106335 RepID=A0A6A3B2E6_HIBSY|nr:Syntaxin-32 [Hibiscus syriacus]